MHPEPVIHQGRDSRLGIRRAGNVQFTAQDHDNMTVPYAGFQLYTRHDAALCHAGGRGLDPTAQFLGSASLPYAADTSPAKA
jgi:hypothetical protein